LRMLSIILVTSCLGLSTVAAAHGAVVLGAGERESLDVRFRRFSYTGLCARRDFCCCCCCCARGMGAGGGLKEGSGRLNLELKIGEGCGWLLLLAAAPLLVEESWLMGSAPWLYPPTTGLWLIGCGESSSGTMLPWYPGGRHVSWLSWKVL
jgi:hypothetical protein